MKSFQRFELPLTLGAIGLLFLLIGLLVPDLNEGAKGFVGNLFAEAVGIFIGSAITIAVIDELLARRERRWRVEKASKRVEGLLLDVAARALWGSQMYEPGDLEHLVGKRPELEPWWTIIMILAAGSKWNLVRLGENQPAPDELTRLSPRIWDIMAVPPRDRRRSVIARKTAVVSMCADDLERIAVEYLPELIDDLIDARASSAVITHWVSVLRHTHLLSLNKKASGHLFAHVAGAIWEVLILLDDSFGAIPHPLRSNTEDFVSDHDKWRL